MNTIHTAGVPPPGFKLLAWEGVGLFVPPRWEIGRHEGDERKGFYRVGLPDQTMVCAMLAGLRLQGACEEREWALHSRLRSRDSARDDRAHAVFVFLRDVVMETKQETRA